MSSTSGQPRNRRYVRVSQQRKTKLRWPENGIEHQNVHRRRSSCSSASIYIRVYTSEANFHKPEIYGGSVRVWATEWDVCTARRLEVVAVAGLRWINFVVCFLVSGGISFFFVFFTSNAHGLLQVRGNLASCTSLLVIRQGRRREATEAVFAYSQKSLFICSKYSHSLLLVRDLF